MIVSEITIFSQVLLDPSLIKTKSLENAAKEVSKAKVKQLAQQCRMRDGLSTNLIITDAFCHFLVVSW